MHEHEIVGYLQDMTRPVAVGERVNMHVIPKVSAPEPDYEAMRRVVLGTDSKETAPTRDERTR